MPHTISLWTAPRTTSSFACTQSYPFSYGYAEKKEKIIIKWSFKILYFDSTGWERMENDRKNFRWGRKRNGKIGNDFIENEMVWTDIIRQTQHQPESDTATWAFFHFPALSNAPLQIPPPLCGLIIALLPLFGNQLYMWSRRLACVSARSGASSATPSNMTYSHPPISNRHTHFPKRNSLQMMCKM